MRIEIKVTPNAPKNEIVGWEEGRLKVKIKAVPEKNRANKELIKFLSKEWNVSKNSITILKGETARIKVLQVPDDIQIPTRS